MAEKQTLAEAIRSTYEDVGGAKADTYLRKKWSYVREDIIPEGEGSLEERAVAFFNRPPGTVVQSAVTGKNGIRTFAVWCGLSDVPGELDPTPELYPWDPKLDPINTTGEAIKPFPASPDDTVEPKAE